MTDLPLSLVVRAQSRLALVLEPENADRGDIPGWVLITIMTAGLVTAVWSVADGQLRSILGNALNSVRNP